MIDLHLHSTASDGSYRPSELVDRAEELSLYAISITDHDTITGIKEFKERIDKTNIKGIPGVEIAGDWNGKEIHILGYWIDDEDEELLNLLQEIRDNRNKRNNKIVEKLNENGYEVVLEEILEEAQGESIGRPHIASLLMKKKYFSSVSEVFSNCLARGGSCYVPRVLPTPKRVIETIHEAGGIAIWAHPLHRAHSNNKVISAIDYFKRLGLDGIESYYTEFSKNQHKLLLEKAEENQLAISGGSDFHGANQPEIFMGSGRGDLKIPDTVYDNLRSFYQNNK